MKHMKENCWDLVGWPKKFIKPRSMRENLVTSYKSDMCMSYVLQKLDFDIAPWGEAPRRMGTVPEVELESMRRVMSQLEGFMVATHPPSFSFSFT